MCTCHNFILKPSVQDPIAYILICLRYDNTLHGGDVLEAATLGFLSLSQSQWPVTAGLKSPHQPNELKPPSVSLHELQRSMIYT